MYLLGQALCFELLFGKKVTLFNHFSLPVFVGKNRFNGMCNFLRAIWVNVAGSWTAGFR